MEVYTPIPEAVLPPAPRAARGAGRAVLFLALFVVAAALVRSMYFQPTQPGFHNYGVVHTSLGTGAVACGGEVSSGCGAETVIRFASCSSQYHDYFDGAIDPNAVDRLVRALIGKRPPSGSLWSVQCGGADGMIHGQPVAHLESN